MEKIKEFLKEDKFKMMIEEKTLYIANYKRVLSIEENYVSILTKSKKINIHGKNLQLKRIVKEELLIEGKIEKIEVIYE